MVLNKCGENIRAQEQGKGENRFLCYIQVYRKIYVHLVAYNLKHTESRLVKRDDKNADTKEAYDLTNNTSRCQNTKERYKEYC